MEPPASVEPEVKSSLLRTYSSHRTLGDGGASILVERICYIRREHVG